MAQNRLANSETNFELRNEFRTSQRSTESYSEIIYQEKNKVKENLHLNKSLFNTQVQMFGEKRNPSSTQVEFNIDHRAAAKLIPTIARIIPKT